MSPIRETSEDAITEEEMQGTAEPALSAPRERNAFTALMSKKQKSPIKDSTKPAKRLRTFAGRDGLGRYTQDPQKVDPKAILYFNKDVVAIHDSYPKSSIHTLLLPTSRNLLHPFEAFEDAEFLAVVQKEAKALKAIVAAELRRKYGKFSAQDKDREAILNGEVDIPDGAELPVGRDWEKDVMVGIHAHPSMNHLHVHVISVDRVSECMKHRKHYNSFATPFFIDIADFPLAEDDIRRHPDRQKYLNFDLKCWRCGENFGNKFAKLKEHLVEELEKWKAE